VSSYDLFAKDTVFFSVKCNKDCGFTVKATLVSEMALDDGVETLMHLTKDESKVISFEIPAEEKSGDKATKIEYITL
jgi:hypothetical protein